MTASARTAHQPVVSPKPTTFAPATPTLAAATNASTHVAHALAAAAAPLRLTTLSPVTPALAASATYTSAYVHLLGLGLSERGARSLARSKCIPADTTEEHGVESALNAFFLACGYKTACIELLERELDAYDDKGYKYIIVTNFRVMHENSIPGGLAAYLPFEYGEHPQADGWTRAVCESLLPGKRWQSKMMRMTVDDILSAPAFIQSLYKIQCAGNIAYKPAGISPDQTDYTPFLKARKVQAKQVMQVPKLAKLHIAREVTEERAPRVSIVNSPWDDLLGRR